MADFETAIAECGFGLFNVFIMLSALPCLMGMVFSAASISFVLPTAECDLGLSMQEKGILFAITYAGMILSAVPWGFMADTMGRRVVLISGGWLDSICVLCAASSQNTTQLMVFKFFDGLIVCGPFAVVVSYLAEFHGKKHRPYMMLFVGLCVSVGALVLPLMAYLLLPKHLKFNVLRLQFHTWHVFLAITAVPSLLSGFLHIFLPESPKFLMSQGNYSKALKSLQFAYALNKRKSRNSYPITELVDVRPDREEDMPKGKLTLRQRFQLSKQRFVEGLQQLKPMCASPYLAISMRIYCLHFCQVMCVNSVRLWLPQIFATMHTLEVRGVHDSSMCAVLKHNSDMSKASSRLLKEECDLSHDPNTYRDNIIVACICLFGYCLFFPIFRIQIVVRHLLKVCMFVCTFLVGGLYFSQSATATLVIAAIYLTIMGVSASTVIGMCVVEFPTLMRTMVILLIMTCGRLGSLVGNMLLPLFMKMNCWAPFVYLSTLMLIAFIISLFLRIDIQQAIN